MNSDTLNIFISDVDHERFGVKTARVTGFTANHVQDLLVFCRGEKVTLLIARCPVEDLAAAQSVEKKGFLLMDTLVYYRLDLTQQSVPADSGIARVRPVHATEGEAMIAVARASFRGYRGHYHADPRLEKNRCDEAYVDWAQKAFAARQSDNFLVGEIGGKVIAFGVLRINHPDEGEMFLGGIHPDYQGQGIYHSFLCQAMKWCISKNTRRMIISTQLNHIAVQKVLPKLGFELFTGYYTFHKWFD